MIHAQAAVDQDIAEEVAAFLQSHPSFLADNPGLYRVLVPPVRVHGDTLADHMAAMIRAERAHSAASASRMDGVVAAGRAAAGLNARVQEAVLALMRGHDPIDCIQNELPGLLGIDAAGLCQEQAALHARLLPRGTIDRLLRGRDVLLRQAPSETRLLHGEAANLARADALVRVRRTGGDALLALAARDRAMLRCEGGGGSLVFLGQALSAALERVD